MLVVMHSHATPQQVDRVLDAIRRTAAGESLLDPVVTERLLARFRAPSETDERLERLYGPA